MIGTLLETIRALAPVVTPGEWRFDGDWYRIPTILGPAGESVFYVNKSGFPFRNSHTPEQQAAATLVVSLRNALPELIAALEVVDLVRDEDWLAGIIKQSDDDLLSGEPEYLARAIIAALPKETDNG